MATAMSLPGSTVFFVDDDPAVLRALRRLIRAAGYEDEAGAAPRTLVARVHVERPGRVVVDLCEPGDVLDRPRDEVAPRAAEEALRARFSSLTPRELDVCVRVAEGLLNKEIAAALGVAVKTVKIHRGKVMTKLGVTSVAQLVRLVDRVRAP
jgi:FixJ family two-component response regulator